MPDYISTAELAHRPGARELAQVATNAHDQIIDDALMAATLVGADRSAWTPEEVAAADAALTRISDAIAEASAVIDGYLVQAGYQLPLDLSGHNSAKTVLTWLCRSITRYLLNKDQVADEAKNPVARDYRDALKRLSEIAAGKFSLGIVDPAASTASPTDVRFLGAQTVFGRNQLRQFR